MNFIKKFIALSGVVVILLCLICSTKTDTEEPYNTERGVKVYLQALYDKDFALCDEMISSDGFYLAGFDKTAQAIQNPVSSEVYHQFLNFVVDSIQSIQILSAVRNEITGYVDYEIEVTINHYKKVDTFDVDKEYLTSILKQFIDEELSEEDFSNKIKEYSLKVFNSLFVLNKDKMTSKVLILSEKEEKDGVVCVCNTKTFIENLISDEMFNNLEVYQSSIKAKIDTILRQY